MCDYFVELLRSLLLKKPDEQIDDLIDNISVNSVGESMKAIIGQGLPDQVVIGRKYSSACYITDSWPSVLYLALKYQTDPLKGLFVNANLGGDNVHRGSILGTIFGLLGGSEANYLFKKLTDTKTLENEIKTMCNISSLQDKPST